MIRRRNTDEDSRWEDWAKRNGQFAGHAEVHGICKCNERGVVGFFAPRSMSREGGTRRCKPSGTGALW